MGMSKMKEANNRKAVGEREAVGIADNNPSRTDREQQQRQARDPAMLSPVALMALGLTGAAAAVTRDFSEAAPFRSSRASASRSVTTRLLAAKT